MAEMEISLQEEMADPQEWKCSPLRDLDFLKISCIFLLCGVQSSPLVFAPNLPIVWSPLQW